MTQQVSGSSGQTSAHEAASRLRKAAATGNPCAPVRDLIGAHDVELAYTVQRLNLDHRYAAGRSRVGRKIGLTSRSVQEQLGVDSPDFGSLLDDMSVRPQAEVATGRLIAPKVEAEIAFWLQQDLDGEIGDTDELIQAIAGIAAAIEIVDSRIADWDITLGDTIADNASSGMFVVSDNVHALTDVTPVDVDVRMLRGDDVVSTGDGTACLGDPLIALLWLARASLEFGDPLRAGEVVLSGALGPVVSAGAGDRFVADFSHLGSVSVSFAEGAGEP